MRRLVTIVAALLVGATAVVAQTPSPASKSSKSAPNSSGTILPGTYDLDVAMGGGSIQGTLLLVAAEDSLAATIHVGEHAPPVRSLTRKGSQLVLRVGDEGMRIVYNFQFSFSGDSLSGTLTYNGDEGLVSGTRRK